MAPTAGLFSLPRLGVTQPTWAASKSLDASCSGLVMYGGTAPLNCAMIKQGSSSATSGTYVIQVATNCSLTPNCCVTVYCDMDAFGGGWTEFQRRFDGSVDFYRNWTEFENGFGQSPDEYWLGNAYIWAITNQQTYELMVELRPYSSSCSLYVRYNTFKIANAANFYQLTLGTVHSGTENDTNSFWGFGANGMQFSTYDQDHDQHATAGLNCAVYYHGAWWHKACHGANLNGCYLFAGRCTTVEAYHMSWYDNYQGNRYLYSYAETKMKIRPTSSGLNTAARGPTLCYSKNNITGTCGAVGNDCIWGAWGAWSACSVSCGNGTRTRSGPRISCSGLLSGCSGTKTENMACSNGTCPIDASCVNLTLYSGSAPLNCATIKLANSGATSGTYVVKISNSCTVFPCCVTVYCDMDHFGGGWLEIQRRFDGSVDFYRNWSDYELGFGTSPGEYWLGNKYINVITTQQTYELLIELKPFEGTCALYVRYGSFSIANAANFYRLSVGAPTTRTENNFSAQHNGKTFTTYDADHDTYSGNCAAAYHGGWWYDSCHASNLNGFYLYNGGCTHAFATHISWQSNFAAQSYAYSFEQSYMKIRPTSVSMPSATNRGSYCLNAQNITFTGCGTGSHDCWWTGWTSWSNCAATCQSASSSVTRMRVFGQTSRSGAYNATVCSVTNGTEVQNCSLPMCPIDASCANLTLYSGSAPLNCATIKLANSGATSGTYVVKISNSCTVFPCCVTVYCDMDHFGGGWLEIQRRFDGSVDFFRNWTQYEVGFGTSPGEYWLGNKYINVITTQQAQTYELLIELKPFEGTCALYTRYGSFSIANAANFYRLSVGGTVTGTQNDSFTPHNGMAFSTYDADRDTNAGNCAQIFFGAWWYTGCHESNLNGLYLFNGGCTHVTAKHINWYKNFAGKLHGYSFEQSYMKIRPTSVSMPDATNRGSYCLSAQNVTFTGCGTGSHDCWWTTWTSWSTCAATCQSTSYNVTRMRVLDQTSRSGGYTATMCSVNNPAPTEVENCSLPMCPINCQWSDWTTPSACSVTCNPGTQTRTRTVAVNGAYGGVSCNMSDANSTQICNEGPCPPVDCVWSQWEPWQPCSQSCDIGTQTRSRTNASEAMYGGLECDTSMSLDKQSCNLKSCTAALSAAQIASRTMQTIGCTWLIASLSTIFGLFLLLRQFSLERCLHMCQEISLLLSHALIVVSVNYNILEQLDASRLIAVALQYLFIVHFLFIMLEAVQTYCILSNVISGGGFCKLWINLLIGWGVPTLFTVPTAAMFYNYYASESSGFWLNMGHLLSVATLAPITLFSAVSIILVEAAGMGTYQKLPLMEKQKRTTALLSRHSLLFILPLTFSAWFLGQYAIYTANVGLYSVVFFLHIFLGIAIFQFHTVQNEKVRTYVSIIVAKLCRRQKT